MSDLLNSGFWILSEDRLLTPARPRYLLSPDSSSCGFAALGTLCSIPKRSAVFVRWIEIGVYWRNGCSKFDSSGTSKAM